MVAEDSYFNLSVQLSNHGDDSYNTSLTLFHPLGLSFSRMTLAKVSDPLSVSTAVSLRRTGDLW